MFSTFGTLLLSSKWLCFRFFGRFSPEHVAWPADMARVGPAARFMHRRTVRFKPPEDVTVDSKLILQALGVPKDDIVGIVPLYGGKCFDLTFRSQDMATKAAHDGLDLGDRNFSLTLLGSKSIHVSVFVSVEFPDDTLLSVLEQYGELKNRDVRRCFFKDEGLRHLENGARVVEFTRLTKDIPKQIVAHGIPIGLKYSGQPNTCFRCGSTEHLVKLCPKRLNTKPVRNSNRGEPPNPPPPSTTPEDQADMDTSPVELHNSSEATTTSASSPAADAPPAPPPSAATHTQELFSSQELSSSEGTGVSTPLPQGKRKSSLSAPLSDDDVAVTKKTVLDPTSLGSFQLFNTAMKEKGAARSELIKAIPAAKYYRCRALYLQHKYGDFTKTTAKNKKHANDVEQEHWKSLAGFIQQDAYAELLRVFDELRRAYTLFHE